MIQTAARVGYLDIEWAEQLLAYCEGECARIRSGSGASRPGWRQTEQALLGGLCADAGWLKYALGQPVQAVLQDWREAAQAYLEVFRLRNTTTRIPVTQIEATPGWQFRFEPPRETEATAAPPDNSLTNPELGLAAMHLALVSGAEETAAQLARRMASPETGQSSPDWQLCLSLASLILREDAEAAGQASRAIQSPEESVRLEAAAVFSFASNDRHLFEAAIERLLESHQARVRYRSGDKQLELFFNLPAAALGWLAVQRGWMAAADLHAALSPLAVDSQAGAL